MLRADAFLGAEKLGQLLCFLVEKAIEGRSPNEYSIALDVFQKDTEFDPRVDPVVRVYIRRLRTKLKEYAAGIGAQDPLEIVLPPRTYVPLVRMRALPLPKPAEAVATRQNVAIRSFRCLSSDKADEYFSDGLLQDIIHAMGRLPHWRVIPVPALECGGVGSLSTNELRERFQVGAVLDGNVRRRSDTVRVSAHLTDTKDGTLLWSEIYDRGLEDIFTLQSTIAHVIAYTVMAGLAKDVPTNGRGNKLKHSDEARELRDDPVQIHPKVQKSK
jgi:adenylate cyclase